MTFNSKSRMPLTNKRPLLINFSRASKLMNRLVNSSKTSSRKNLKSLIMLAYSQMEMLTFQILLTSQRFQLALMVWLKNLETRSIVKLTH